jgi:flagellar protein FliT
MSSLALLQQMSAYSTEMVDAARANDWDRLTRLERQVASLRDRLGVEEALGFRVAHGRCRKRNARRRSP